MHRLPPTKPPGDGGTRLDADDTWLDQLLWAVMLLLPFLLGILLGYIVSQGL